MPNLANPPSTQDIVSRANALALQLSERASECATLRQVPEPTITAFLDAGLHKIMQPRRYGGWSLGWEACVASAFELGKGDGAQGWVLAHYADQAQIVSTFSERAQDEVWGREANTLVAGAHTPAGVLVPRNDGYVVSGTWPACVGIDHAAWLLASGQVDDGEQQRRVYFLVPKSAATIIDDWYVSGLTGAGSKSFTLSEVVVPQHRVLDETDYLNGTGPGTRVNNESSYRFPRDGALLGLAAVPLGIAMTMLEGFIALACDTVKRGRRVENNYSTSLRIGESKAEIDAGLLALLDAARTTTAVLERGENPTSESRALNNLKSVHGVTLATRAVDRLWAAGGAKVNLLSNPLQRYLLDVHAVAAQDVFNWDKRSSRYGRVRLGESL